jgi:hypothetical protein
MPSFGNSYSLSIRFIFIPSPFSSPQRGEEISFPSLDGRGLRGG